MNRDLATASDSVLVLAVGRWDQDALGELYRRHGGAVFGLAKRVLRDRALAEEIVQEVFLRLWDSPDRFDPERGSLRAYLLAQTHSRSIDVIRSDTARRRREEKDHRRQPEERPDIEHEVWDLVVGEHVKDAAGMHCRTASARRSSSRTSAVTRTGRSRCSSTRRRAP